MTNETLILLALGVMLTGVGLGLLGWYLGLSEKSLDLRLGRNEDNRQQQVQANILRTDQLALPANIRRLLMPLASFGEHLAGTAQDRHHLNRLLSMAGFRAQASLGLLMVAKYANGLLFLVIALFGILDAHGRFGLKGLAMGLIALFVGSTLPEAWLKWRAARRGGRMARSVPDGLDLMVICAEAGLPLGRIMQVVAKELALSAPELADELRYTYAELQIVSDRSRALINLAERTGVREIESMVATLIQAERYGTPLSQALRTIADESRKTLVLGLEEKAGKLPAQMSVPLMVLILPPIIAVMGAPAMIRLVRVLAQN